MKNVIAVISVLLVLSLASLAGADIYRGTVVSSVTEQYNGTLVYTSDVWRFHFGLANDANVHIYTDSWTDFTSGNFDPAIYLWNGSGVLIAESIDIDPITNYNASLQETLSAGNYTITLVLNGNIPAKADPPNPILLSDGFSFDSFAQQDLITTFGVLGNFHVFFDVVPVPEPSTFLLFAGGLLGVGMLRKKFKA
ncbi:MAG: DVUA0089 family protein [Pedobacter sp.]